MKKFLSTIAALGALGLFASPVLAASVGVGADTNLQVGGGLLTASSTSHATLGASASGSSASATGTAMREENSAVFGNSALVITAADAMQGGATISSSSQVASASDLDAYVRGTIKSNADLKEVDASGQGVTVKYVEPGMLFGIFPLMMASSATIAADGTVSIGHPWYYFLTSTGTSDAPLKSALSTEAAATFNREASAAALGATSTAQGAPALTASEEAQLVADINLALSAALAASTTASASAEAAGVH